MFETIAYLEKKYWSFLTPGSCSHVCLWLKKTLGLFTNLCLLPHTYLLHMHISHLKINSWPKVFIGKALQYLQWTRLSPQTPMKIWLCKNVYHRNPQNTFPYTHHTTVPSEDVCNCDILVNVVNMEKWWLLKRKNDSLHSNCKPS